MRVFLLSLFLLFNLTAQTQVFFDDFDNGQTFGTGIGNPVWSGGTVGLFNGASGTCYAYQGPETNVTFSLSFDVAEGTSLDISGMTVALRRSNTGPGASWSATVNGTPATFAPTTISTPSFSNHASNTTFSNLTGTVVVDFTFNGATPGTTCQNGTAPLTCGTVRLDNFQINGVLPITLSRFEVKRKDAVGLLYWNTASEHNNAYFSIERSADGRNFEAIGQIRGAGNTYEPQNYAYTDERPLKGLNYYRLKQVDFDGTHTYSRVASVVFGHNGDIRFLPSPATDLLQVLLEEPAPEGTLYEVFDQYGRFIKSGIFVAESKTCELDLSALPQGSYLFRLVQEQSVRSKQFLKQ